MVVELIVLAAFALVAFFVSTRSRWLALCATVTGGLTVTFFFMPPIHSLRVSKFSDLMTLLAFGTGGILLTHVGSRRSYRRAVRENEQPCPVDWRPRQTCTATALEEALAEWNDQLCKRGIQVRYGVLPFPLVAQPRNDVVRVFSDLIGATLASGPVRGVWCHATQLPGRQCFIWCVERTRGFKAPGTQLVIRSEPSGEPIDFDGWPDSVTATRRDDEFEMVFRVTFAPEGTHDATRRG